MRKVIAAVLIGAVVIQSVTERRRRDEVLSLSAEADYFFLDFNRHFNHTIYSTVVSSYSLHSTLTQIAGFARGPTAEEIILALGLKFFSWHQIPLLYYELHRLFENLYNTDGILVLDPAIAVACGNKIIELGGVSNPYLKEVPLPATDRVPCISPEAIRSFLEYKTEHIIEFQVPPNLLAAGSILLLSAMVVKAEWQHKFPRGSTYEHRFVTLDVTTKRSIMVHMMTDVRTVRWKRDDVLKVDVVEIPLRGRELGFYIVLPHATRGLLDVEKRLLENGQTIANLANGLRLTSVRLAIPKFSKYQVLKLRKVLQAMGVVKAFSAKTADFEQISYLENIYLSEVLQAISIQVNEEGISQSAGTPRLIFGNNSNISPTQSFLAYHPFSFFIRHNFLERVLISGKYTGL